MATKVETVFLKDVVETLSERKGASLSKSAVKEVLEGFIEITTKSLKAGKKVRINGLGTFAKATRAARTARNPATGETVKVKAAKTVRFKASTSLKGAM